MGSRAKGAINSIVFLVAALMLIPLLFPSIGLAYSRDKALEYACKSALNINPPSASNFDPPLAVILTSYFWS